MNRFLLLVLIAAVPVAATAQARTKGILLEDLTWLEAKKVENGATRFVPGSHLWTRVPGDLATGQTVNYERQVAACGPAGSIVIYNGSVWHGHGANRTSRPRRSLQGAHIRSDAMSGATSPLACVPKLSTASVHWQSIYWRSKRALATREGLPALARVIRREPSGPLILSVKAYS